MSAKLNVLTVGNAIVDIFARCDDAFLDHQGIGKSMMNLVDADRSATLYAALDAPQHRLRDRRPAHAAAELAPWQSLDLSVTDLAFRYASRPDQPVLQSLSFNVQPGEMVAGGPGVGQHECALRALGESAHLSFSASGVAFFSRPRRELSASPPPHDIYPWWRIEGLG